MTRWKFTLWLVVATLTSFACGFIVSFAVMLHGTEHHQGQLRTLQDEATVFFYDTIRELFAGTHDHQDKHVSAAALDEFNTYRTSLEPRCWLVNMHESYGVFYGEALFPSGDVFEPGMQKTDNGWVLIHLNHMGSKYFFHDLK